MIIWAIFVSITEPSPPTNGSVCNVTEKAFAITWIDENPQSYTDYDIIIPKEASVNPNFTEINGSFYRFNSNISSLFISKLDAGKLYEISIYTVIVFDDLWQRSTTALNLSTYTGIVKSFIDSEIVMFEMTDLQSQRS